MNLKFGNKIEVYRNLQKQCFSIRHEGKVVEYLQDTDHLRMYDATFVVQPAGREKVLKEKRKNVHAFVRGYFEVMKPHVNFPLWPPKHFKYYEVTYDPYKWDTFIYVQMPGPIHKADIVDFYRGGVYATKTIGNYRGCKGLFPIPAPNKKP